MKHLFALLLVIILTSCSGLLWDARTEGDLALSISNPFYQPGRSASSRALALQGKFLYIELAQINDQAAFDADTAKAVTGNGTWIDTGWGGHAVLTMDLNDLTSLSEEISATFTGVPRGRSLKGRVFLDSNEAYVTAGIKMGGAEAYDPLNELLPICQTYNTAMTEYKDIQWIPLSSEDLLSNQIVLPIRPFNTISLDWSGGAYQISLVGEPSITMPPVGSTGFYSLEYDLAAQANYVRDVAYFSLTQGTVLADKAPPLVYTMLYDNLGNPFPKSTPTYTPSGSFYDYKDFQLQLVSFPDYSTPAYLASVTILPDSSSWMTKFGLLFDQGMKAGDYNSDLEIYWFLPEGILPGSLEFKAINIEGTSVLSKDIDTIDKIYAHTFIREFAWNEIPWNSVSNRYYYTDIFVPPELGTWAVVLARVPGGEPFIYGKTKMVNLMF